MKLLFSIFTVAAMVSGIAVKGGAEEWRTVFEDDFNRTAIGSHWRFFGNGRQYLSNKAVRVSHSVALYSLVPLPHNEVRVELDVLIPQGAFSGTELPHAVHFELRGGEPGSGGNDERFEVILLPASEPGAPSDDPPGTVRVKLDQSYHVILQISGGNASLELNGKPLYQKAMMTPSSEVNRYFVFTPRNMNSAPGKDVSLSNFKVWAGPTSTAKLPLRLNTPEENRLSMRKAADFIDPANPAPGIQKAIDSLPPSGGVVVLPAGEFLMRRHLRLRSNVSLCGQGAGKTILKAASGEKCPILSVKTAPGQVVVTVAPADGDKFRVGDAVCFNANWANPAQLDEPGTGCVVMSVADGQVTVSHGEFIGRWPPWVAGKSEVRGDKELRHWFPLIYAHNAEFVEIKDMTLVGGKGGWGAFQSAALTYGQVAGARVSRVHITQWEGDGFSMQTCGDAIVTDNTASNSYNAYHPGGCTQRFLWSRNLGLGNRNCGLYFCWHNRNGVYHRNTLDRFDGYGWPYDIFNVITRNVTTKDFAIEQSEGGGGVIFNNRFPLIKAGSGRKGSPTFDFLVAENRADELRFVEGDVARNLFVGNLSLDGMRPTMISEMREKNSFQTQGAGLDLSRFPAGIERTAPAEPPALPKPVLDGATLYRPEKTDAGFQDGLDQLAKGGGTLLLPAGRYGLSRPLTIPSNVTLAGCGLGTVLHAARPEMTGSLIVAVNAEKAVLRDLVVLGEYERRAFRAPAIVFQNVRNSELVAVDVRGWEGTGFKVEGGGGEVRDCRALGCAGDGFEFVQSRMNVTDNIARECANGFTVGRAAADSLLEANIASGNRGDGYRIEQAPGIRVYTCNASFNERNGIMVKDTEKAEFVANMLANNNQSSGEACGLRLAGTSTGCRVFYNNCQDTQVQTTQAKAIVEEAAAGDNVIRFNLSRMPIQTDGQESVVGDNILMK